MIYSIRRMANVWHVASGIGIWLYDANSGQELNLLIGHTAVVNSVSFSLDGHTLASASSDRTVRLWDVATGNFLHTLTKGIQRRSCAYRSVRMAKPSQLVVIQVREGLAMPEHHASVGCSDWPPPPHTGRAYEGGR